MKSLQGHLLIAAPSLIDPNFFRTVVLMVQHDKDGALGVVLNRPMGTSIKEAWNQVGESPCLREDVLHHGGPCEGPLMVVHTCTGVSKQLIHSGLYFSTDKDDVQALLERVDGQTRFFVGYAGWTSGQLESELSTGSWITLPATAEHVFHDDVNLWENATRQVARAQAYPKLNPKIVPRDPKMN